MPVDARIPLAGMVVDLLPEAYKDKGPWIRKAPLKLIFPGARAPYAEKAVIFFPDTAAEKEQWCASVHSRRISMQWKFENGCNKQHAMGPDARGAC